MLRRKKIWKKVRSVFAVLLILLLSGMVYLFSVAIAYPPKIVEKNILSRQRSALGAGCYTLDNSWFRKSKSGLYEMYVEGQPFQMGAVNGKLSRELVIRQEDHFNEQISKIIPSRFYLHFLKYFIGWFNRNLDKNVPREYKEEIYGVSASATDKYQYIGSNYQRILNYHAAHDIGHALQSMALVGCTSFGTWNSMSEDSAMIIGRNFDFYVGDKFAEDKIVAFFNPARGHKFMIVTWGGFVGAVSGMNDKGLTVTINAAKSNVPTGSATPVSLVAREVLQYAENITQAIEIARRRKMFVSESFLVGSVEDNKAVIIEKTPEAIDVYDPHQNMVICANHFQSPALVKSNDNVEQVKESASMYRYRRLAELLDNNGKNTVQKTVNILRNRQGLNNSDIGMGNEKAINQLIAHHSIVFEPKKLLVWVSTSPWQLGKFIAYDLNKVFAMKGMKLNEEICEPDLTIAADSFLQSKAYANFITFRNFRQQISDGGLIEVDSLVASNPQYYNSYVLAGDYLYKKGNSERAVKYYRIALTKVIATRKEEKYIRDQIAKIDKNRLRQ